MLINNRCVSLSEPTLWFSWIYSLIPQKLCSCLFVLFVCLKRCICTNINVCFCCQQGHLARQYSCTCSGWTSRCIMLKHSVLFHSLVAFQHGYLKNRQRTWPRSSHIWPTAPTDKGVFQTSGKSQMPIPYRKAKTLAQSQTGVPSLLPLV